jgi:hypothetical protein
MRALPHAGALNGMLVAALALFLGAGTFVASRFRRWRRSDEADRALSTTPPTSASDDGDTGLLDARIDAELAEIDR